MVSPTGLEPVWFVTEMQWYQEVTDRAEVENPSHARPTRQTQTVAALMPLAPAALRAIRS